MSFSRCDWIASSIAYSNIANFKNKKNLSDQNSFKDLLLLNLKVLKPKIRDPYFE